MSKEGYDADYEACRIQIFISNFKDRQLKKIKRTRSKIKKLTGQITQ